MKQPDFGDTGNKKDVANHRLQVAKEDLNAARVLLEAESYRGANNRAYYAIFHAISAVLALEGIAFKRHKDILAYFNKNYVAAEIFPREMGRKIVKAEEVRHASDYDTFYIASKEDTIYQVETADELIQLVSDFCQLWRDGMTDFSNHGNDSTRS